MDDHDFTRQRGAVLVIALFFVALAASLAYFMMAQLEKDTRRTSLLLRDIQANLYAQGSVAWAIEQLRHDLANQQPGKQVDSMPILSPKNEVRGYTISSIIYDAQARMNVNNLSDVQSQASFKRLLQLVAPQFKEGQIQQMLQAVVDWITPEQKQNEYSQYYLSLSTPYRAAHRNMVSISELQLVKGMTPQLYTALQPYLIALPPGSLINVQTASPLVMAALSGNMTLETGNAIDKIRSQVPIVSIPDFLNLEVVKNHDIPSNKITTISNYFLVETTVAIEKQHVVLYTLLDRENADDKDGIRVIWQSKTIPG